MDNNILSRIEMVVFKWYKSGTNMAKALDLPQTTVNTYLNGRIPNYEFLYRLLSRNIEINPEWLILGEGDMLRKNMVKNNQIGDHNTSLNNSMVNESNIGYQTTPEDRTKDQLINALTEQIELLKQLLPKK